MGPEPDSRVPVAENVTSPVEFQASAQGGCNSDARCDWSGQDCFFEFGIDTNYFDCHDSENCVGNFWTHSACDCAWECLLNADCQTWVWETDGQECWLKRREVQYSKAHSCRISGTKRSCQHR